MVGQLAITLAGRASAAVLAGLGMPISRSTVLRVLLDLADFGVNTPAREFGDYSVCYVRHGKAMKGSPPKRRSVLTVWPWTADVLDEWTSTVRPLLARPLPQADYRRPPPGGGCPVLLRLSQALTPAQAHEYQAALLAD